MKIKRLSRMETYRSVRKQLPPPQRAFTASRGKGGYDRKHQKRLLEKEFV